MQRLDQLHTSYPYYGARRLVYQLQEEGFGVGRKRVRRLLSLMGISAVYPKPRTSQGARSAARYPYLLAKVSIARANQVWASDITYIPMKQGYLYLVAILDWYSRKVLSWRLSNTLDHEFCQEALEEAIGIYGAPAIFNSDQGKQFTCDEFRGVLKGHGISISVDGKGRWLDNVLIERLWRSLKYECVYMQSFAGGQEARVRIGQWLDHYNSSRPHLSLGGQFPAVVYARSAGLRSTAVEKSQGTFPQLNNSIS